MTRNFELTLEVGMTVVRKKTHLKMPIVAITVEAGVVKVWCERDPQARDLSDIVVYSYEKLREWVICSSLEIDSTTRPEGWRLT